MVRGSSGNVDMAAQYVKPLECGRFRVPRVPAARYEMNPANQRGIDALAAIGLGIGAVFGMAGTFVSQASLRQAFWAVDGVGLIIASALASLN